MTLNFEGYATLDAESLDSDAFFFAQGNRLPDRCLDGFSVSRQSTARGT